MIPQAPPKAIDCGDGVRLVRDVELRLSDGTVLRSDHYLPPGGGPAPALLVRQPYGKDIATTVVYAHPVWFARHGYVVVVQDVRGRGASGGGFYPFQHEEQDGHETLEWLSQRPECNGRIGMYGFSYQGVTQLLAAARGHPALRCIAPWMTAGDLHRGWFYQGGLLRLASTVGWATQMLRGDAHRLGPPEAARSLDAAWSQPAAHVHAAPFAEIPHLTAPELPGYYSDWIAHDQPGPYWERQDISTRWEAVQVPALHLVGWHDLYLHGGIQLFESMRRHAGRARDAQHLVAGPWVHIPWGRHVGEIDMGPEAMLDTDALLLRWFDHWLKDAGTFAREPRARLFAMGDNCWHRLDAWPGGDARCQAWHLRSGGRANGLRGDGWLSLEPPDTTEPRDTFVHDPDVPVVAPGGPTAAQGCFNQARAEQGNNLLVYTSKPLEARLHVCGTPRAILHLQSSLDHCDLVVKLVRVLPDGRALNVSLGAARSSALFAHPPHRADAPHAWHVEMESTSCVFAPGERLRVEVASSAFPLFDRNPGSGVPSRLASPRDWLRARQQVLHDAAHPSRVELPLLEEPMVPCTPP